MNEQMTKSVQDVEIDELFRINDDRSSPSKVIDLETALRRHVKAGMVLHFAYSEGRPMAISNALVRCFKGRSPAFTIVGSGLVASQAALVSTGLVRHIEATFVGENYPTPAPNRILQQAINRGDLKITNLSLLALYQRLAAGALGVPFYPTRSWAGSSLAENDCYARVPDPFGEGEVGVLRALVPDITFVHGLAADRQGNILLSPPFGEAEVAAFASRHGVIATVEKIVSSEEIMRNPALMKIPAHRVLGISEAPLGCHPYGIFTPEGVPVDDYVDDRDFFMELRSASENEDDFAQWTEKWIFGTKDHADYVEKLGKERVAALKSSADPDIWRGEIDGAFVARARKRGAVPMERMVVAAADVLREKVVEKEYGIIEAGVGYANLAAWLATSALQSEDARCVELVAEIGLYGFSPRPGEPFIFSHRNLPTSKAFTNVESLLGMYVAGRHNRCIAIIGAGQIDSRGNINSTFSGDGRFLVGSGGANDITAGASEVVVVISQRRDRLVEDLPYVTSNGSTVSTLVTDMGVFEKRNGTFALTRYFPLAGLDEAASIARIRENCGWELTVDPSLVAMSAPDSERLLRLRLFDPRNDFFENPEKTEAG